MIEKLYGTSASHNVTHLDIRLLLAGGLNAWLAFAKLNGILDRFNFYLKPLFALPLELGSILLLR